MSTPIVGSSRSRRYPLLQLRQDEPPPAFGAEITYNGTGWLVGRWEVVLPGE